MVTLTNGATNVLGAVNNIVTADTSITNLTYQSKVSFIGLVTNYHTTLINPGSEADHRAGDDRRPFD